MAIGVLKSGVNSQDVTASTGEDVVDTVNYVYSSVLAAAGNNILDFGADGTLIADSAAAQAVIDAGYTYVLLPYRSEPYKLNGLIAANRFSFVGVSGKDGQKPTIEASGTVITIGAHTGAKLDNFETFRNIKINVIADVVDGVFDMRSCRNFVIDSTVEIYASQQYWIGTLVKSSRSYQCTISAKNFAKGVSLIEIGDNAGGEVLDNINLTNALVQGNVAIMQRDNVAAYNLHNISIDGLKCRESAGSGEATLANQGMTHITSSLTAGDTIINVTDATQLKQGNLVANDLIYIGQRNNAEYVRVLSKSGNAITLDTPLRFNHSNDANSSGIGEPVIYGPVYITLDSVRGLNAGQVHFERGFVAMHLHNPLATSFGTLHDTSKNLIMCTHTGKDNVINTIQGGNTGWAGNIAIMNRPAHANTSAAIKPWKIASKPVIDAPFVTQVGTVPAGKYLWSYQYQNKTEVARVFASTTADLGDCSDFYINMDGSVTIVTSTAGLFVGQKSCLHIRQDATGGRIVFGFDATFTLIKPYKASTSAYAVDTLEFEWNGTVWVEQRRSPRITDKPYFVTTTTLLNTIAQNINAQYKEKDLEVLNSTTGLIVRAVDGTAGAIWVNRDGTTAATPV